MNGDKTKRLKHNAKHSRTMKLARTGFYFLSIGALVQHLQAADPSYLQDISKWHEAKAPRIAEANWSAHEWRVFLKNEQPCARLISEPSDLPTNRPGFIPKAEDFTGAEAFAQTDDGWLVGFNRGEFGAALYWFSPDGKKNYKVSRHQVVDFFSLSNGIHAIEGLAHLGISRGSIIRVARTTPSSKWQADVVAKLPEAPCSIAVRKDNTAIVTLSDSLVSVDTNYNIGPLLTQAKWTGLYPNSSIISKDEHNFSLECENSSQNLTSKIEDCASWSLLLSS